MGVIVENIDIQYVDEFIDILRKLASDDHWKNTVMLNSIRVLKYEQEHPSSVIDEKIITNDHEKIACDRRIRLIEGYVALNEDGSFTMKLPSDVMVRVGQQKRSYRSVMCYYLKSHFPELTSKEIMEQVGYIDASSVNKSIVTVDNWYLTGIFPKSLEIITEEYTEEMRV